MFKKLRLRLTFFCALATGLALFGMTAICLWLSGRSARDNDFIDFQNDAVSVFTYIGNQSLFTHTWLSQMEHNYHMTIDILDGEKPLLFSSLHTDASLQEQLERVRQRAAEDYQISPENLGGRALPLSHMFSLKDANGNLCYAAVSIIPRGGSYLDTAILKSTTDLSAELFRQRLLFGSGACVVWMLLTAAAFVFIGRMLRPIEQSRENQTRFIASASHELRSPLTVILASLSAARVAAPDEQARFFDTMESEGARMTRLIGDMLTLASSDAQTWSIRLQETPADTLLLEAYENHEAAARQKDLHFLVSLPDTAVPQLLCDRERILQVLAILIDNAFSYTPAGASVTLSLTFTDRHLTYRVEDNGPGIPDEQKEKIFERFYRADNARSSKQHFGLGLCIAREIAALHKGSLTVSDAPGGGATFSLTLPCH